MITQPSLVLIGLVVSEKKIFEKVCNKRRMADAKLMAIVHMALWARWAKNLILSKIKNLNGNNKIFITRVSSFKIVSGDAVHQPTWPLLLKIEHMVKLQVFG
jgi:hypothetical protein